MTLKELLNLLSSRNPPDIQTDSRLVKHGDVFVAVKGTLADGHNYIDQACANGAKYIVSERNIPFISSDKGCKVIIVDDTKQAGAILAQAAKGNPSSKLVNLAVTGTNGKTTVAFLVQRCIQQAGQKCGLIGTVIYDTCSDGYLEAPLTTPDCLTIADAQEQMVKNGAKYMVIEASSHALSQNRLWQINFKAAAFTNLSGDHLDYHKTEQDYLLAKTKLFSSLSSDAIAVLNLESPKSEFIARKTSACFLWYAIDRKADLTAHIQSMDISGTVFSLEYEGESVVVRTPLLGRYNVSNILAAAGLCLAAGLDLETIGIGLSYTQTIPGRLEKLNNTGQFTVIIDYAHTDDALKNVLVTLKPLCKGRLRVVFGCGGDRDRTKRPRMAKVAEEFANDIFVTSDNPRTENPNTIIEHIVAGFEHNTHNAMLDTIMIEPDRRKAIELALSEAKKDDIVVIAGKGHEDYQIIGNKKNHFSDKEIAEEWFTKQAAKLAF